MDIPGLEACELKGAAADAVIRASKFGDLDGLSLAPIEDDDITRRLHLAGFFFPYASRSTQND